MNILAHAHFEDMNSLLIVAVSLGLGMILLVAPTFFQQLPAWTSPLTHSGITVAAISAILLNAFFNRFETTEEVEHELAADMPLSLDKPDHWTNQRALASRPRSWPHTRGTASGERRR